MRVVFLSTDNLDGYVFDDELAAEVLRQRGVEVETIPWRADRDWAAVDCVVLRTTWDYQAHLPAFLEALTRIEAATKLHNPLSVVRWNVDKRYLLRLADAGVPIVPTRIFEEVQEASAYFQQGEEIVVKPTVGATALDTHRLRGALPQKIAELFRGRPHLVQPFMPTVQTEGEVSLFFFEGALSHAIRKTPKAGDFRSQEEHGGLIEAIDPPDDAIATALAALSTVDERLLYARVDLVRGPESWLLMELELVEPALYFRMDAGAAARFADALLS